MGATRDVVVPTRRTVNRINKLDEHDGRHVGKLSSYATVCWILDGQKAAVKGIEGFGLRKISVPEGSRSEGKLRRLKEILNHELFERDYH
ncbi:hypothetical protein RJ035_007630, partial [Blastomyces gilchristii]